MTTDSPRTAARSFCLDNLLKLKPIDVRTNGGRTEGHGWPHDLDDEEFLQRLVDLNHERAEEEKRGLIRWFSPEFQNPTHAQASRAVQSTFTDDEPDGDEKSKQPQKTVKVKIAKQTWPKSLPERMVAVQSALTRQSGPATVKEVAGCYTRVKTDDVEMLLQTLLAVGLVRRLDDGRYAGFK